MVVAAACGKKGPPLAPFVRVPAQVANVAALRLGEDVYLSFPVPLANVDGQQPADISAIEVYAVTSTRPPETVEQRKVATLITTLPVRPIVPELPLAADGTPLPALPIPHGVDRGATAVVKDALTPASRIPVELPLKEGAVVVAPDAAVEIPPRPLVAPTPIELPRRHYFVIAVSPRGRAAEPSSPVSIPIDSASGAPGTPDVTYTASEMIVTWPPSPDARTATFAPPPLPEMSTGATVPTVPGPPAPATPANASPGKLIPAPPPLPPLTAKSLGFNSVATTYHVYDVPAAPPSDDPLAITLPVPLSPQPLAATSFPIKAVTFGAERCFVVRPVDTVFGVVVHGPASPVTCVTPLDTFPPAAPKALAAIGSTGVINLIWEPNAEPDLAGYLVLRGEAPGDKLQAITPAPITATNYPDTTVTPGVRYVYVVVAVDKASPQNVSAPSNRAEEAARQ